MNRNNFTRFAIVLLVVIWSVYQLYPPSPKDLVKQFSDRAVNRDTNFTEILQKARDLEGGNSEKGYESLRQAIGSSDITRHFPFYQADKEVHPTTFVSNRLQREAAGKIRLGLDLQGGTSFRVKMDTSSLTNKQDS